MPPGSSRPPIERKRLWWGLAISLAANLPVGIITIVDLYGASRNNLSALSVWILETPLLIVTLIAGLVMLRSGRGAGHGLLIGLAIATLIWCGTCVSTLGGGSTTAVGPAHAQIAAGWRGR
jgi:hypothetical protein